MCVDIDECLSGTHHCLSHQQCINIPGSYSCSDTTSTRPTSGLMASSTTPRSTCPYGTVWNVDLRQCLAPALFIVNVSETTAVPLKRKPELKGARCPDGGVWNEKSQQCDLPLAVTMYPVDNGMQVNCPEGSQYNGRTGGCEESGKMVEQLGLTNQSSTQQRTVKSVGRCPIGYAWNRASRRCEGGHRTLSIVTNEVNIIIIWVQIMGWYLYLIYFISY